MNVQASFELGIFLLQKGGAPAAGAAVSLARAYREYAGGRLTMQQLLSEDNLSAAGRVLTILAQAAQDPGEVSNIRAIASSL